MGRLRASLPEIVGVQFNRTLAAKRLWDMGVTDPEVACRVLDEMESAHSRNMFLQRIREKGKRYEQRSKRGKTGLL